jgi:hypothetical protein
VPGYCAVGRGAHIPASSSARSRYLGKHVTQQPEMDAADMRLSEAMARLGGMNRAAAELHTVQSNVTARIRALEARLGAPHGRDRLKPFLAISPTA